VEVNIILLVGCGRGSERVLGVPRLKAPNYRLY
jgi:hypothetical protein